MPWLTGLGEIHIDYVGPFMGTIDYVGHLWVHYVGPFMGHPK